MKIAINNQIEKEIVEENELCLVVMHVRKRISHVCHFYLKTKRIITICDVYNE